MRKTSFITAAYLGSRHTGREAHAEDEVQLVAQSEAQVAGALPLSTGCSCTRAAGASCTCVEGGWREGLNNGA